MTEQRKWKWPGADFWVIAVVWVLALAVVIASVWFRPSRTHRTAEPAAINDGP